MKIVVGARYGIQDKQGWIIRREYMVSDVVDKASKHELKILVVIGDDAQVRCSRC